MKYSTNRYGEREIEISEKYRKPGWDTCWENDEWWNEAETMI